MSNQPFTLYSPEIDRETNEMVSATELRAKLIAFYSLYKPQNAKSRSIDNYMEYARGKGVLALRTVLKHKYKCNLEDADSSEVGWGRILTKLKEYYNFHCEGKYVDINKIFAYAQEKGLLALDKQLQKKYGETLSEFMTRELTSWKNNWFKVLQHHHEDSVTYELKRFYNFVEQSGKSFPKKQPLDVLVQWACKHSRTEVNEKLLSKYTFGLDDVPMVKGITLEERKVNLKAQIIEFYQEYAPEMLGNDAYELHAAGNVQEYMSKKSISETEIASKEMQAIDSLVDSGIIAYEQLQHYLKQNFNVSLQDNKTKELRARLIEFYSEVSPGKQKDEIEKILSYGLKHGLHALNEKLVLTYGYGIPVDDLQ